MKFTNNKGQSLNINRKTWKWFKEANKKEGLDMDGGLEKALFSYAYQSYHDKELVEKSYLLEDLDSWIESMKVMSKGSNRDTILHTKGIIIGLDIAKGAIEGKE